MSNSINQTAVADQAVEERKYWHEKLAGERRPSLPRSDYRRPADAAAHGERSATVAFELDGAVLHKLTKLTGGELFLEYAVLVTAVTIGLYRHSQASPIAIGCPAIKSDDQPGDPHNAVVVHNEVDGRMTFRQLLLEVRRTLIEAHARQRYPLARLAAELYPEAPANRCPFFDLSLVHGGLHYEMPELGQDVALSFERQAGRISGTAAFRPGLYERVTIARFCQHLVRLLRAGLEDPGTALAGLEMLTDEDKRRLLVEWNDTCRDYPRERCIHELFEARVERGPDDTALAYCGRRLSYRELDERSNQLAHHLQSLDVAANTPVGIFMSRSPELVVAVLAVLKAGGVYVPYDPGYPRERVADLFEDVRLKALLTQETLLERLPEHKPRVVCLDRDWEVIARQPTAKPQQRSGPGDLCYVIFTSGSTGRPKAAAVYHHGWTNLLNWFVREFDISPFDKNLLMSSISFDITQRSMAMSLISGGELHLMPDGYDPALILDTVEGQSITLLNCAPSTFYPLLERAEPGCFTRLRSLRCLFLGGEAISASRLRSWAASSARAAEIVNVYGAAECSDVSSFYRLQDFDRYAATSVPIGKPIDNSRVYVVDEDLRLAPIGVEGEICLAGDGVGRGYVNDAVLTAKKPWSRRLHATIPPCILSTPKSTVGSCLTGSPDAPQSPDRQRPAHLASARCAADNNVVGCAWQICLQHSR